MKRTKSREAIVQLDPRPERSRGRKGTMETFQGTLHVRNWAALADILRDFVYISVMTG